MSLWGLLEDAAERRGDALAVVEAGHRRTYAEVRDRAAGLAGFLAARGVRAGERVAILEHNTGVFLEAYFAAARAGAILVPLNVRLHPRELASILTDAEPRWLLAGTAFEPAVRAALALAAPLAGVVWTDADPAGTPAGDPGCASVSGREALSADPVPAPARVRPADVAQLYYTSGTTGRPKGVMLTHAGVGAHAEAAARALSLSADDVWGHVAPMFHLADAWATFAVTAVGGRHALLPSFDAAALAELVATERVTLTNLIPTMLQRLLALPAIASVDVSSLRLVLTGGAPIAPALVRRAMELLGCEYVQTYGMTETCPYLTLGLLPEHLRRLSPAEQLPWRAKTGRPFETVELRVTDEAGRDVPPDGRTVGEIRARGITVTPGYWRNPAATAAAFEDGWLLTGDLAVVDAEGFLDIVDRKKDVILTGGETVYTTEVESALYEHPAVLEAAVFCVPDPEWGEAVTAAVALRPGARADADELRAHCRARLAGYKVPVTVRFLDELPRTGSGKIAKRLLRGSAPAPPPGR